MDPRILVIAHRGASKEAPENTLAAFDLAINKYHVDMIEFDVRVTKDLIPVVFHDEKFDRMFDRAGLLSDCSFEEMRALKMRGSAAVIPSLEEVMRRFPEMPFLIEVKERQREKMDAILGVLNTFKRAAPYYLGSLHTETSHYLNQNLPSAARGLLAQDEIFSSYLSWCFRLPFQKAKVTHSSAASIPTKKWGMDLTCKSWIEFLHQKGIKVFFWTINDAVQMKSLIQRGADGILTDDLKLLCEVANRPF